MPAYTPPRAVYAEDWAAGLTGPDAGEKPGGGLTPRQQAFCRAMLGAGTAAEAARIAGYAPEHARQQASRLLRDPRVTARIAVLRRSHRPRAVPFLEPLLAQLQRVYARALAHGDFRAAIKAVEAQAHMLGRFGVEAAGDWLLDGRDQDALEAEAAALEIAAQEGVEPFPEAVVWDAMNAYARAAAPARNAAPADGRADGDVDPAPPGVDAAAGPTVNDVDAEALRAPDPADAVPTDVDGWERMLTDVDASTARAGAADRTPSDAWPRATRPAPWWAGGAAAGADNGGPQRAGAERELSAGSMASGQPAIRDGAAGIERGCFDSRLRRGSA